MKFRHIRNFLIATIFLISFYNVSGQDFNSHVRYGGGIGLSFGNGTFSGSLSPSAIYQFDKSFALGVGLNVGYNSWKNHYSSTVLGGSLIGLYNVIPEIQLSAELEELHVSRKYEYDGGNFREDFWYPALYLGAGFRTGNFTMGIRYDVLYDRDKSIYAEPYAPFVRIYF
ncbi:alpha-ketoglutarate decarboxylase [Aequorivita sp. H23M31]|uniref:Alpha-ketoglutarate decarboxylase n=2 Tax=Aequorivita ciconiae TaxID=2494375 RepID=A0A410G7T3_9FLAO|nr:alpha-ketoglutarate decarboxylase [Aequorivita sp. H23M31]